jgi:hypothetical protein
MPTVVFEPAGLSPFFTCNHRFSVHCSISVLQFPSASQILLPFVKISPQQPPAIPPTYELFKSTVIDHSQIIRLNALRSTRIVTPFTMPLPTFSGSKKENVEGFLLSISVGFLREKDEYPRRFSGHGQVGYAHGCSFCRRNRQDRKRYVRTSLQGSEVQRFISRIRSRNIRGNVVAHGPLKGEYHFKDAHTAVKEIANAWMADADSDSAPKHHRNPRIQTATTCNGRARSWACRSRVCRRDRLFQVAHDTSSFSVASFESSIHPNSR